MLSPLFDSPFALTHETQVCCHCGKQPMAVPTLTSLEEEKKQAQAADEELQVRVCRRAHLLSLIGCSF